MKVTKFTTNKNGQKNKRNRNRGEKSWIKVENQFHDDETVARETNKTKYVVMYFKWEQQNPVNNYVSKQNEEKIN